MLSAETALGYIDSRLVNKADPIQAFIFSEYGAQFDISIFQKFMALRPVHASISSVWRCARLFATFWTCAKHNYATALIPRCLGTRSWEV